LIGIKYCASHKYIVHCAMTQPNERIAASQVQPLRGARILIAEDDAILAFDLKSSLERAGAHIAGPVATLADALALAGSAVLTCALLDINLRRDTVFPAAQVLKERGVRMIFHTAQGEWERLKQEWPGVPVLIKPAPPSLLIRTLCEACHRFGPGANPGCRYCQSRLHHYSANGSTANLTLRR
jgi:CheY-like chemotaxis protein